MTNNADPQRDLEKQEDVKAERTRRLLKWAIVLSVIALLAIIGVAIPMALKVLPGEESTSASSAAAAEKEPTNAFNSSAPEKPETPPPRPAPVDPSTPTDAPTESSPEPSSAPSVSPAPTDDQPSSTPSAPPSTLEPTLSPTPLDSATPTKSLVPTAAPIDPNYAFKIRLFWQRGYYWQESFNEVWHCVECTKCNEYGAGDGVEHGCQRYPNGDEAFCKEGDMFWIMGCNGRGARFNVLQNKGSGYQIRLNGSNLCMGRGAPDADTGEWKRRLMRAVKCDQKDRDQLWAPFETLSKFELRPFEHAGRDEDDADCVSQLHHPKDEEVISMHGCKLSRIYETRYWEEY